MTDTGALLRFENVTKRFGGFAAVDRLSLDICAGELFALLGPSGCGKSTLLRLAAGLDTPDEGRVLLDGEDLAGRPPHLRPVNMMFQSYALFPHMTVAGNIAFGLKQDRLARDAIAARVAEALAMLRLEALGGRKPDQLSGGQRQRVALARALVKRPKVLLLDEPLGALDKRLRDEMQAELAALQRRLGTAFVMVTHDQEEAMSLSDRMAVMDRGRIMQVGAPAEIYERPASLFVAGFMGDVNLIPGASDAGAQTWIAVRPENVVLMRGTPAGTTANALHGTVVAIEYLGHACVRAVRTDDGLTLKSSAPNRRDDAPAPAVGDSVWATWPVGAGVLLER